MEEGKSACLVAKSFIKQGHSESILEDFKIKKVIDKGSFGKVFLVINKKNGEYYAMKRINKDMLLDKNAI